MILGTNLSTTVRVVDHNTETPAAQSSQAKNKTLSPAQLEHALQLWIRNTGPNENRQEAAKRIVNAYENQATALNLENLGLSTLPTEIGKLTALTNLYLERNRLSSLPPEIGKLTALTGMFLNRNQITSLPPEIGKLSALTWLNLNDNQLTNLPAEIGKLTALTKMYLSSNRLTSLPTEIGNLIEITELDLEHNPLTSLPPEISKLAALTSLSLSNCPQLSSLPAGFECLPAHTIVQLENTGLSPNVLQALALRVDQEFSASGFMRGPDLSFSLPASATRNVMPLSDEIIEWFTEAKQQPGIPTKELAKQVEKLPETSSVALATLLLRLKNTGVYQKAPEAMVNRVCNLLNAMLKAPEMLETFCAMALESTATCDDRTALGMLNMELAVLQQQITKAALAEQHRPGSPELKASLQRMLALAQGSFKQQALMNIAQKHAQTAPGAKDETEIVLKYITNLGKTLDLPVQWSHMLYQRFAWQVTEEHLAKAKSAVKNSATLESPEFLSFMASWHPFLSMLEKFEPQALKNMQQGVEIMRKKQYDRLEELEGKKQAQASRDANPLLPAMLEITTQINQIQQWIPPESIQLWQTTINHVLQQDVSDVASSSRAARTHTTSSSRSTRASGSTLKNLLSKFKQLR